MEFDIDTCKLSASKHFKNGWMRKRNWDYRDLRDAIRKKKYEVYVRSKGGSKKIIFVYYEDFDEIFVITGAEGT